MKAYAINPKSGEKITVEIDDNELSRLKELERERVTKSQLNKMLDQLDISADGKALIFKIIDSTITIGNKIIKVGKKIVEIILYLAKDYPNTTFGLILGIIISLLASSIPILGALFGPFLGVIITIFTLGTGFMEDIKDKALLRKIKEATQLFEPLKGHSKA